MSMRAAVHSWWTQQKLNLGLIQYGRQGDPHATEVRSKHHASLAIKVIRTDGTVEDLGVVSEADIELTAEQRRALGMEEWQATQVVAER